ncbi:hypothetical protein XU18_3443 [Perkinsela sp. CCAP 1560/4]|nr:hypothetical protein XU18_3443 [Perkinsela sp. CCAP 1560/4]|eukprot:KNH05472.1 hypothetical protein XU18_3443 [Perkinsela sp. CCAP 1560/4]
MKPNNDSHKLLAQRQFCRRARELESAIESIPIKGECPDGCWKPLHVDEPFKTLLLLADVNNVLCFNVDFRATPFGYTFGIFAATTNCITVFESSDVISIEASWGRDV